MQLVIVAIRVPINSCLDFRNTLVDQIECTITVTPGSSDQFHFMMGVSQQMQGRGHVRLLAKRIARAHAASNCKNQKQFRACCHHSSPLASDNARHLIPSTNHHAKASVPHVAKKGRSPVQRNWLSLEERLLVRGVTSLRSHAPMQSAYVRSPLTDDSAAKFLRDLGGLPLLNPGSRPAPFPVGVWDVRPVSGHKVPTLALASQPLST